MLNLTNADALLRTVYRDALTAQIEKTTSPFLSMIKKGNEEIVGKEIQCTVPLKFNSNVYMTSEDATIPEYSDRPYMTLTAPLRNIYGKAEISDKILRASELGSSAMVSAIGVEMNSLLQSAKYHFERALIGTPYGIMAIIKDITKAPKYTLDTVDRLQIGMNVVAMKRGSLGYSGDITDQAVITKIDYENKLVTLSKTLTADVDTALFIPGNYNNEINGINYIFDPTETTTYGVNNAAYPQIKGTKTTLSTLTLDAIQDAFDRSEILSGTHPDLVMCSYDVRKIYHRLIAEKGTNVDYLNLDGGFKALSFSGVPVVASRFVGVGEMMILNTQDFKLCSLNDWDWIEGGVNGSVLHQIPNKAAYSATLVKYANLICTKGCAQQKFTGITQ